MFYLYGRDWDRNGWSKFEPVDHKSYTGYGELFNHDGFLIYRGDFVNGRYHGGGVEFHSNGKPKSIGTYKNSDLHTIDSDCARICFPNGETSFIGQFKNGKRHGWGKEFYNPSDYCNDCRKNIQLLIRRGIYEEGEFVKEVDEFPF